MPGRLRMEWPRIPLPGWPDGKAEGAAQDLAKSAARGRELANLLDSKSPVPGVTAGTLRPEIAAIAVPSTVDGLVEHVRRRFRGRRSVGAITDRAKR